MSNIRKNTTTTVEALRPGDSILNFDGSTRVLIKSAPTWLPRQFFDGSPRLVRMEVETPDYSGPMIFTEGDFVYANVVVGALRIRVQAIKPTGFRGQRFRVIITTPSGRRIQRTLPRDYSWDMIFPAKDAARVIATEWFQTDDVEVEALYGNLTPGSTTFAAREVDA